MGWKKAQYKKKNNIALLLLILRKSFIKDSSQNVLVAATSFIHDTFMDTFFEQLFVSNIDVTHNVLISDDIAGKKSFVGSETFRCLFYQMGDGFIWFEFHSQCEECCLTTQSTQFLLEGFEECIAVSICINFIDQFEVLWWRQYDDLCHFIFVRAPPTLPSLVNCLSIFSCLVSRMIIRIKLLFGSLYGRQQNLLQVASNLTSDPGSQVICEELVVCLLEKDHIIVTSSAQYGMQK
mmetsp:Transcript_19611/g.24732  ORF Transcript_19611/g.24732 Transcript_19611/m.24732 type:complete len:236 (-) Transcript_19611:113-820(-)